MHDTAQDGLKIDFDSIKVWVGDEEYDNGTPLTEVDYTVVEDEDDTPLTEGDYTVTEDTDDECTFHIVFEDSAIEESIDEDETEGKIYVGYSATLTATNVVVGEKNEDKNGNVNEAHLTYGDNNVETPPSETRTYTYRIGIIKTDDANVMIEGAEFKLYKDADCNDEIKVVKDEELGGYRLTTDDEADVEGDKIEIGQSQIVGLATGTYWLKEIKAPDGYNKLTAAVEFKIEDKNNDVNTTTNEEDNVITYQDGGLQIENRTGGLLPSTGGVGTTIFYIVGAILVLGAVILLITRRRMNSKKD